MDEFIPKPIRKRVLVEKLSRVLADHPLVRAAAGAADMAPQPALAAPSDVTPPAKVAPAEIGPILDRATFDELVDAISAEGVRATLDVFIVDTVARLDLLRRLSCDTDRTRIRDEAHTLKGASGTFGLRQLSELAQTLEHSAHVIAPADYRGIVDRLDGRFKVARDDAERVCAAAAA